MDPDVIVSSPASKKGLNLPKPVIAVVLVILIIVSAAYLTFTGTNLLKTSVPGKPPAKPPQQLTVADFKKSMVKNIKTSFASSKDAGVLAYVDLASTEKDDYKSYRYYVSAFEKMKKAYQSEDQAKAGNKAFAKKLTMIELKAYASVLPFYKESDFVVPK